MNSKLIGRMGRRDSDAELYDADVPSMPREPGPFFRKFREKFVKQLQDLCGVDGKALMDLCKVKYFHSMFYINFCLISFGCLLFVISICFGFLKKNKKNLWRIL